MTLYDLHLKAAFLAADHGYSGCRLRPLKALVIPDDKFSGASSLQFVELSLKNADGEVVSRNFYWVPTKLTEFDWSKTDYTHTPAHQP